jgi:hypothetical protein
MDESISPPPAAAGIGVRVPRYLILFFGALVALGPTGSREDREQCPIHLLSGDIERDPVKLV